MRQQLAVAAELPCRIDPELFFAEKPEDVERARALCRDCPVRAGCLAGALPPRAAAASRRGRLKRLPVRAGEFGLVPSS